MRIALFGGTGRTGSRLLRDALAAGHDVRALVRDASRLVEREKLELLQGDVLDPAAVARTVAGVDAVLAALGGGTTAEPGVARSQGTRTIAEAMETAGVRRIVAVGGAGVLDADSGNGLRNEQPGFPAVFRAVTQEHVRAYEALRDTSLEWTFVGAPDIPDGDATGQYRVLADRFPPNGKALTTGDLAAFMLKELVEERFLKRRVGIAT